MKQQSSTFFTGKVILITGSSKGIGLALARQLGRQGAKLILNGRNEKELFAASNSLKEVGFECLPLVADVSQEEQCHRLVNEAVKTYGSIDALFANAGLSAEADFEASDSMLYRQLMEINFLGVVQMIQACLPYLKQSKGSILITGSAAGIQGIPGLSAYSASKMALTALAQPLRIEFKKHGIYIGLAYVGITENDHNKLSLDADGITYVPTRVKGRPGKRATKEQVAIELMEMVEKRRFTRVFSQLGKLSYWVSRIAPQIAFILLSRHYSRKNEYL